MLETVVMAIVGIMLVLYVIDSFFDLKIFDKLPSL